MSSPAAAACSSRAGCSFRARCRGGESLAAAAGLATRLLLGVFPLLIVAGLIEGFISPGGLPPSLKLLIGAALFTLLALSLPAANRASAIARRPFRRSAITAARAP